VAAGLWPWRTDPRSLDPGCTHPSVTCVPAASERNARAAARRTGCQGAYVTCNPWADRAPQVVRDPPKNLCQRSWRKGARSAVPWGPEGQATSLSSAGVVRDKGRRMRQSQGVYSTTKLKVSYEVPLTKRSHGYDRDKLGACSTRVRQEGRDKTRRPIRASLPGEFLSATAAA